LSEVEPLTKEEFKKKIEGTVSDAKLMKLKEVEDFYDILFSSSVDQPTSTNNNNNNIPRQDRVPTPLLEKHPRGFTGITSTNNTYKIAPVLI